MRKPADLAQRPSVWLGERAVVLTPFDTPWLSADECFVASNVEFAHLLGGNAWQQYASTQQLLADLRNPSLDVSLSTRVGVHARFVQPLLDMALFFLGLPLGLTHDRRKVFVVAGASFALIGGFQAVVICCQALGGNGLLTPALAAWAPLLILAPVAAFIVKRD
jgi:lipopolysaccharide export LptBFGC system permease protein LptF